MIQDFLQPLSNLQMQICSRQLNFSRRCFAKCVSNGRERFYKMVLVMVNKFKLNEKGWEDMRRNRGSINV